MTILFTQPVDLPKFQIQIIILLLFYTIDHSNYKLKDGTILFIRVKACAKEVETPCVK